MTRVLLADDHRLVREALRSMLEHEEDIEVIGEASTGREAIEMAQRLTPDIVVMDIGMPDLNGIDATVRIVSMDPAPKVIALSTHGDRRYVAAMIEAGACGYVVKSAAGDELVRAIRAVQNGNKYLSPEIAGTVVDAFVSRDFPTDAGGSLGAREREVLQLLAEGKTSPQIATKLFISVSTVEAHRRNIMRKLDIHSIAELTKYAIREGLTTL